MTLTTQLCQYCRAPLESKDNDGTYHHGCGTTVERLQQLASELQRQNSQGTRNMNDAYETMDRCLNLLLTVYPNPKGQSEGRKLVNHLLYRWFPGR
jgi:hypothetical protein